MKTPPGGARRALAKVGNPLINRSCSHNLTLDLDRRQVRRCVVDAAQTLTEPADVDVFFLIAASNPSAEKLSAELRKK
jgi:hypothetical protein